MPNSLKLTWAPEEVSVVSDRSLQVVSVDWDGNVLSRYQDSTWTFPYSSLRPSARLNVKWPKNGARNICDAKQLAFLRLTHGSPAGPTTAFKNCRTMALLAAFCDKQGLGIRDLRRYPLMIIDFCSQQPMGDKKSCTGTVARVAHAFRKILGWTFLEPEQIRAIEAIEVLEAKQYPVIPSRIHNAIDTVAESVLDGFIEVVDELDAVCAVWATAKQHHRHTGGNANWKMLLRQHERLEEEINRWAGKASAPLPTYADTIRKAAFWVIAGGSCARKSEILSIQRGCLTREVVGEGQAWVLTAGTTKTQQNPNAIWIVSPRVKLAIQALERMLEWYEHTHPNPPNLTDYLFQVMDFSFGRQYSPSSTRSGDLAFGEPHSYVEIGRLTDRVDTNITQADWEEAKRLTPTLDEAKFSVGKNWVPSGHQLRRTVLVRAAASGLVSQDSLSFQAKHQTWKMTSYYCQNYWYLASTDADNPLVTGVRRADAVAFSEIYADSYNEARSKVLNDDRFFSTYGDEHKRATINGTPLLTLAEIKSGQAAGVLKRNTLGLCAQAEFCEWQAASTVRGCLTKSDGRMCSKAIVDVEHLPELIALEEDLRARLESLRRLDHFARTEIEADIDATRQAIAMIEDNLGENREQED